MSKSKRIENFVTGLLIILAGLIIIIAPGSGYKFVDIAFGLVFAALGIKNLIFYFSLARFMTGGLMALFRGFIYIDLGIFAFSIMNAEKSNVMMFIMLGFAVAGIFDVIKALELKKIFSPFWKLNFAEGIVFTILPLFSGLLAVAVIIRGVVTLLSAFRRTAVVYVGE